MQKISTGKFHFEPPSPFTSFDHLVGAGEQGRWHVEVQCLGGRDIDDEVEFGRLLDRDVAWLRSVQYFVHKIAGAAKQVWIIWSVRHQTSRFDELPYICDRWQSRDVGQGVDANPINVQERIGSNIKRLRAVFESLEGRRDILGALDFKGNDFEAKCAGGCLNLAHFDTGGGVANICQDRQPAQASDIATRPHQARDQSGAERVRRYREHNRNDGCRLLGRDRWESSRNYDIDLASDKLGRELGGSVAAAFRPAILDREVAPLDPA